MNNTIVGLVIAAAVFAVSVGWILAMKSIAHYTGILDALVSDEPDSHYDPEVIMWRERVLRATERAFGIKLGDYPRGSFTGFMGRVYCKDCGGTQTIVANPEMPGGVTMSEARSIGWLINDVFAICPICAEKRGS